MGPTGSLSRRLAGLSLAVLIVAHSCYSFFWAVALPSAQTRTTQATPLSGCEHEQSSCRCLRCAGPSKCPCDHGTTTQGAVCGSSQEEHPLSAQDSTPPVPAKMM